VKTIVAFAFFLLLAVYPAQASMFTLYPDPPIIDGPGEQGPGCSPQGAWLILNDVCVIHSTTAGTCWGTFSWQYVCSAGLWVFRRRNPCYCDSGLATPQETACNQKERAEAEFYETPSDGWAAKSEFLEIFITRPGSCRSLSK